MNEQNEKRKIAAEKFAEKVRKLAEDGCIKSISITINSWSSDDLFESAKDLGIKTSIIALFGA